MTEQKLVNCPCCNGGAEWHHLPPRGVYFICCNTCKMQTGEHYIEADAVGEWNTRASTTIEADLKAEVGRLRGVLENIANIDVKDLYDGGECPYQHTRNIIENAKYAVKQELNQED